MSAKHTPTPWFNQPGFRTIYSLSNGNTGLTCALAKVFEDQSGREQADANAEFIVRACNLLGAGEALAVAQDDAMRARDMLPPDRAYGLSENEVAAALMMNALGAQTEALAKALEPLAAHADYIEQFYTADELAAIDQEHHLVAHGICVADCFRARVTLARVRGGEQP